MADEPIEEQTEVKRRGRPKKVDIVIDPQNIPAELVENKAPLGAGRTPKALQLKRYEEVLKRLDDNIDHVLDTLFNLVDDPDPNIRMRVCEMILRKYLPDKKVKEVVGPDGGPVQISQTTDTRVLVLNVVETLDELDIDQIKKRSEDGSFRFIEVDSGTKS